MARRNAEDDAMDTKAIWLLLLTVMAIMWAAPGDVRGEMTTTWLDDLDLSPATSGWGRIGPGTSCEGNPIRIAGVTYERGIGVHAASTMHLELGGRATRFKAVVGVDDEVDGAPDASVRFHVIVDRRVAFDSGVMRAGASQAIDVDLTGAAMMSLLVDEAGDGIRFDHADWADARIEHAGAAPVLTGPAERWTMEGDGSIRWDVAGERFLPHGDHIEMAGLTVAAIIRYRVDAAGQLQLRREVVWPMLRTIPNDTHGSLMHTFNAEAEPEITVGGEPVGALTLTGVSIRGMLRFTFETGYGVRIVRTLSPSVDRPMLIEHWRIERTGETPIEIEVTPPAYEVVTEADAGVDGSYILATSMDRSGAITLEPGGSASFSVACTGRRAGDEPFAFAGEDELQEREDLIDRLWSSLRLETPDPTLNRAFAFAKLRGSESIYATRGGLMHGPGGGRYYAALWTNDQCEYINPLFPFLGYDIGNESALNCFEHYMAYMDPDFEQPLVSSIIAEGDSYWNGAGDRGDAAMYAYGAGRFALAYGDEAVARALLPAIEWCLEYCRRQRNDDGVVASDCDELEFRFPAGDANLCTSSLYYDALLSAAHLVDALGGEAEQAAAYRERADVIREAIESHFGATVEGFETYRYYEGNDVLRAWICIPLTVGIHDRAEATIDALFSPRLWTIDGLATQAGRRDFWDRSTLYALRGVLAAGGEDRGLERLTSYTRRRLLGEHVPYPVEAYPEGGQRHLSAESGLYCRVFTEGLFGMRPVGFRSFDCTPRLPPHWDFMALRHVRAFGDDFDLFIERMGADRIRVRIVRDGTTAQSHQITPGETVRIDLSKAG
jgi:hypothetical protein